MRNRLTERDLTRIVKRIIKEQAESEPHYQLYECLTDGNNWVYEWKKISGSLDKGGNRVQYSRKSNTFRQILNCERKFGAIVCDILTTYTVDNGGVWPLDSKELKTIPSEDFTWSEGDKILLTCDQLKTKVNRPLQKIYKTNSEV